MLQENSTLILLKLKTINIKKYFHKTRRTLSLFFIFSKELLLRKTVINVYMITAKNSMYYICQIEQYNEKKMIHA